MTLNKRKTRPDFFLRATDAGTLRRTARRYAAACFALLLLDQLFSLLLLLHLNGWRPRGVGSSFSFREGAADAVCSSAARLVLLPLLAWLAVRLFASSRADEELTEPLLPLSEGAEDVETRACTAGKGPCAVPQFTRPQCASRRCGTRR